MWRVVVMFGVCLLLIKPCLVHAEEPSEPSVEPGQVDATSPGEALPGIPDTDEHAGNDHAGSAPAEAAEPAPAPQTTAVEAIAAPGPEQAAVQTFEGIVLDPNGLPIQGAVVRVQGLSVEAKSGKDGSVTIQAPLGSYTFVVEAKGFEPLEESLELDDGTAMTGFELMLEYKIEDVVVTGTSSERLVDQAPVKTQVVGRTQIERRQASNLAEALDGTTGVRTEANCQNCGFTQIRLNGLEGPYTQILIDGRPVISSLAGVYLAEQIPEEMIERVEVVKGGGSALYGGNAVGGVVNVITRKPSKNFGSIMYRVGALGVGTGDTAQEHRLSANGGIISPDLRMALHLFAGLYRRDEWDANDDGFSEIGRVRQMEGGASAYFELLPNTQLQIKFHILREQRRGGDMIDRPEHAVGIAESIHMTRLGFDAHWKHWVTGDISYEFGYGMGFTERDSYYGGGGNVDPWGMLPDNYTDFNDQTWAEFVSIMEGKQAAVNAYGRSRSMVHTADAAYNQHFVGLGDHILTVGAQFNGDQLEDSFPEYDRDIDVMYWNVAGFVQHQWIWADWGEWVLGLRVDKHSELDQVVPNPRIALKFTPLQWLKLRTSFATGFRAPQTFDEDLHITIMGGEGQIISNAANLDAEKSYSVSQQIAMDGSVGNGWKLSGGVNGFFTIITDMFALDQQDDPLTTSQIEFLRINSGDAHVYGGEIEFGTAYRDIWQLDLGLTIEKAESSEADPDFGTTQLFRTPTVYGMVSTFVQPFKGFEINMNLDITGPMKVPHYEGNVPTDAAGEPVPQLEESPWFVDWDAGIAYRWDLKGGLYIKPFLGIKNILNAYQDDLDTGDGRDAGYVYGPRTPRLLYGGIKGGF